MATSAAPTKSEMKSVTSRANTAERNCTRLQGRLDKIAIEQAALAKLLSEGGSMTPEQFTKRVTAISGKIAKLSSSK